MTTGWLRRARPKGRASSVLALAVACAVLVGADAQSQPKRIVSLVPAVTEMIFALGAGDRVVGVSSFDRFPPQVEKVQKVGALLDPDIERIIALKPDLVVVYHSQADLRTQLARASVPIFTYAHAGLPDVFDTLRGIGARLGLADRSTALATKLAQDVDRIRQNTPTGSRPRTLVVFGRENFALRSIFASGGVGFIHDMVTAAGGDNIFADVKRESVQATTELILARRPEVILELRAEGLTPEEEKKELTVWGQLQSVPAVRNRRVHLIVDPRTVIPGPRIAEGLEVIAARLHRR